MKALKTLGIIIVVLLGAFAIWNASLDKAYNVSRSVVINAQPETISATVSNFETWPEWSAWFEKDSTMSAQFKGQTSGAGASYSWTSETQGGGNMTILTYEAGVSMTTEINFDGQGSSNGYWRFTPTESGTEVVWGFKGEMPFFMRWMGAAMDEFVGPDFEKGLGNLKVLVEHARQEATTADELRSAAQDAVEQSLEDGDL